MLVHTSKTEAHGRSVVFKLKELIDKYVVPSPQKIKIKKSSPNKAPVWNCNSGCS
jgi:hypothetical protein